MPEMKSQQKFSVLVPTRERADTLYFALLTCTRQSYENLEIIVSDNASTDNTKEVVHSFKDTRIRYFNTEKRVGMSSNWEFALSKATGDFITFIGDDDGLLPEAVTTAAGILEKYSSQALIWKKAEYNWPSHTRNPHHLAIPVRSGLFRMDAQKILHFCLKNWIDYPKAPCLYTGFVSRDVIRNATSKNGKFFNSVTPDVYSGFALLSSLNDYLFSKRPLSVNGGSGHSNGANFGTTQGEYTDIFLREMDIPIHPNMPIIPGAAYSSVIEALLQANDHCFNGKLKINMKDAIKTIFLDLRYKEPVLYQNGVQKLLDSYQELSLEKYIIQCSNRYLNQPYPIKENSEIVNGMDLRSQLIIDAHDFGIQNIAECCEFVYAMLGPYTIPKDLNAFSFLTLVFTWLNRKSAGYINSKIF